MHGAIPIGLLLAAIVMFIMFFRVELIVAAMISIIPSIAVSLAVVRFFKLSAPRPDWFFAVLLIAPPALLSVCFVSRALRIHRMRLGNPLGAISLTILVVVVTIALRRSASFRSTEAIALISSVAVTAIVLPPMMKYLLPRNGERVAPAFGAFSRNDIRRPVRALYNYLDIPAEQYVAWKLRLDPIFLKVDSVVPASGDLLDAGCGFGIMSHLLALRSASRSIVGIDLDEKKLRIARCAGRTVHNVRFVAGDLFREDFPLSDCVLLIDVLHYWTPEGQTQIIARCAAALRPGGTLIFREGLRSDSRGHQLVDRFERWAVLLGHNPRGDGLHFQTREFYIEEFARCALAMVEERADWGHGSNAVLVLRKGTPRATFEIVQQTRV